MLINIPFAYLHVSASNLKVTEAEMKFQQSTVLKQVLSGIAFNAETK